MHFLFSLFHLNPLQHIIDPVCLYQNKEKEVLFQAKFIKHYTCIYVM